MAFAGAHSQDSPAKTPNYAKNGKNNNIMSFFNTIKAVQSLNQTTTQSNKDLDTNNLTTHTTEELENYISTHQPKYGEYRRVYELWQVKAEIAKRKGLPIPVKPSNPFGIDYSKKTENTPMSSDLLKEERIQRMLAIEEENKEKKEVSNEPTPSKKKQLHHTIIHRWRTLSCLSIIQKIIHNERIYCPTQPHRITRRNTNRYNPCQRTKQHRSNIPSIQNPQRSPR